MCSPKSPTEGSLDLLSVSGATTCVAAPLVSALPSRSLRAQFYPASTGEFFSVRASSFIRTPYSSSKVAACTLEKNQAVFVYVLALYYITRWYLINHCLTGMVPPTGTGLLFVVAGRLSYKALIDQQHTGRRIVSQYHPSVKQRGVGSTRYYITCLLEQSGFRAGTAVSAPRERFVFSFPPCCSRSRNTAVIQTRRPC